VRAASAWGVVAPPMKTRTDIGPGGAAHVAVLVGEVVEWLRPRPGACLVDATVGLGGHAAALLAAAPGARLLGLDRDRAALARAAGADAVLLDLGVSSLQLDDPARGFSFRVDAPLDMRMDAGSDPSAAEIVNQWSERELARILAAFGEEPRARALARAIARARPLRTTGELARVIGGVLGRGRPGLHPATRSFQAIRMAVNDELGELERFLADGYRVLRPRGRLAVLAYHSLEDRRVKDAFRRWAADCLCPPRTPRCVCGWSAKVRLLTRRPLRPSAREVARNPRARSARLRIVERLEERA